MDFVGCSVLTAGYFGENLSFLQILFGPLFIGIWLAAEGILLLI
tara:strand:- start:1734 stop:1865 length:132 start_codon:yes stop_codon:yes gene_type:complete